MRAFNQAFAAMLVISALAALPAMARRGGGKVHRGTPDNQNSVATPPNSMNKDPNAGIDRPGGNSELNKDAAAMTLAEQKVKTKFEASSEWTAAQDGFQKAQSEYNTARATALANLNSNADYVAAKQQSDQAQAAVDALRNNLNSSSDDISAAATASLAANTKLSQMKIDATAADPAVAAAKAALAPATTALSQLRDQEHQAVLADPDYQAAKQKYDSDRTALKG